MTDTNSKAQVTEAAKLIEVIKTRFLGVHPDDLDCFLEWDDWTLILAALAAQEKPEPGVAVKGLDWVNARSAMINMPINSPDYREKLNALSEAENGLVAAIRVAPSPDLPEGDVESATSPHLEEWPRCLTLRDTKVYADEGQRIYTTATGHGYEKREYVLASVASSLREALHDLLTRPTDAAARQRARDAAIRSERSGE